MGAVKKQGYWSGWVGSPLAEVAFAGDSPWGQVVASVLAEKQDRQACIRLLQQPEMAAPSNWPLPELYGVETACPDVSAAGFTKIVLLGPESSGKSTLAAQLSEALHCPCLGEYVRRWIDWGTGFGGWPEMAAIAQMQWAAERALERFARGPVVLDTALPGVAQWSQTLYGQLPEGLGELLEQWHADQVLLLAPDLPWRDDPQRCQPELAERWDFFHGLEGYLQRRNISYGVISGRNRLQQARQQLAGPLAL